VQRRRRLSTAKNNNPVPHLANKPASSSHAVEAFPFASRVPNFKWPKNKKGNGSSSSSGGGGFKNTKNKGNASTDRFECKVVYD
jgi:hypothetical protein